MPMKMLRLLLSIMMATGALGLGSSVALAQRDIQFGGLLGFRSGQTDTDVRGASTSSRSGWQFGVQTLFPIAPPIEVRSGFAYTQRFTEIKNTAQGTVTVDYSYFDVPLTVAYRFNEAASVFGGPVIAFNQSKEVSCTAAANCAASDVKSVIMPLQLGISFKFLPQMGGELYYEYISGDLSNNVQNMRTVGANLIFYFE